jgi:hypothetical protein
MREKPKNTPIIHSVCVFVSFSRVYLLGILIFKGLIARRLSKLFGVKGLSSIVLQGFSFSQTRNKKESHLS